jgi:hypothetical protein
MSGFIGDKMLGQRSIQPIGFNDFGSRYNKSSKQATKIILKQKLKEQKQNRLLIKKKRKALFKFKKDNLKLTKGASRRPVHIAGFKDFDLFSGLR